MTAEPAAELQFLIHAQPAFRSWDVLRRFSAAVLATMLVLVAVLVAWRRAAGALEIPLSPGILLAVGSIVTVVAASVRLMGPNSATDGRSLDWRISILVSLAVLLFAMALSLRETAVAALAALWMPIVLGECWAFRRIVRTTRRWEETPSEAELPETSVDQVMDDPVRSAVVEEPEPVATSLAVMPAEDIVQQLSRSRTDDGTEQLTGWLRADFAPGQRTANVHVAFCPPFPKTPEITVEQADGPAVRIKTGQLVPYGARLDLKLGSMSEEPQSVVLEFTAQCRRLR